ncbi:hypothetical protein [Actinocorallia libanotica]|uniref:Lipoprotein n=1 Tax=Actinocorallia libanotica TaxID=46162 RepID=A0ABN1RQW5_9ACTN
MGALTLMRSVRFGVLPVLVFAMLAGCSRDKEFTALPDGADMPVAHPGETAEKVARYAKEIGKVIGPRGRLDRTVVLPVPCGGEGSRRSVPGRNTELDSWWVSYSPYAESIDTFVELDSADAIRPMLARLRDGLREAGWQIVEYAEDGGVLKAAAPEAGYGATFEGLAPTSERSPRIGVNVSSPCLRHPGAG